MVTSKACPSCHLYLPMDSFSVNRAKKTGRDYLCKKCLYRRKRDRYAKNREAYLAKSREQNLKRLYGLTLESFGAMLVSQNNSCALCYKPLPKEDSCVDHNHSTGAVRGILHKKCNSMIGLSDDSHEKLLLGAAYLAKHGSY